jgi:hypothetical protein
MMTIQSIRLFPEPMTGTAHAGIPGPLQTQR